MRNYEVRLMQNCVIMQQANLPAQNAMDAIEGSLDQGLISTQPGFSGNIVAIREDGIAFNIEICHATM